MNVQNAQIARRRFSKRRRLQYELLESRCMLSADSAEINLQSNVDHPLSHSPLTWFESIQNIDRVQLEQLAHVDEILSFGVAGPVRPAVGEWIVQLTDSAVESITMLNKANGLLNKSYSEFSTISGLGTQGSILVRGQGASKAAIESDLSQNENVKSFSLNQLIQGQSTSPNDPEFVAGLMPGLERIDAANAWDVSRGSSSTVVGVVDTGIDPTHPDLYLNIWINQGELPLNYLDDVGPKLVDIDGDGLITFYDLNNGTRSSTAPFSLTVGDFATGPNASFVVDKNSNGRIDAIDLLEDPNWADGRDTDNNGFFDDFFGVNFRTGTTDPFAENNPSDELGHGTHVAGTIGAIGSNGTGVAGVNWQTSLMSLRILDNNNQGDSGAAIRAINYARQMREQYRVDTANRVTEGANVRVLNNSWGQPGGFEASLEAAIQDLTDAGILFVAAAGNGNFLGQGVDNDRTPFYPASYNVPGVIAVAASDSSDRPASFSNYGATSVDVFAPGVGIRSTLPGGGYGSANGTSMATPHVSGTAALIWSFLPGSNVAEVKQAILGSVSLISVGSQVVLTGGRLNASASINAGVFSPVALLNSVAPIVANAATTDFLIRYQSQNGINLTTLNSTDLSAKRLWGPKDFVNVAYIGNTIESVNAGGASTSVLASYRITAPGGSWDALDFGGYEIAMRANEVASIGGTSVRDGKLGRFDVRIENHSVFYVNSLADEVDSNVGDGIAITANGFLTLRAAIQEANAAAPSPRTIILPTGTFTRTNPSKSSSTTLLEAHNDFFKVGDSPFEILVGKDLLLANDFLAGKTHSQVTITGVSPIPSVTRGTLTLDVNGTVHYMVPPPNPFPDPNLADKFDYTLSDGVNTSTARVTLDINSALGISSYTFTRDSEGDLAISGNVTIAAEDPATTIIDADGYDRVFTVNSGASLRLQHVTIANGQAFSSFPGGGVLSFGTFVANNTTILDNHAGRYDPVNTMPGMSGDSNSGGGIASLSGSLTINQSSINGNAARLAGGVFVSSSISGSQINSSLLYANRAGNASAVFGPLNIVNSTLSGNRITMTDSSTLMDPLAPMGAIAVSGATLTHVSVVDSIIINPPASFLSGPTVRGTVKNSLFAGNPSSGPLLNDFEGVSQGGNVFEGLQFSGQALVSDRIGAARSLLGPLRDNGGATQTHALLPGSIARGLAIASLVSVDQRGETRAGTIDSGAFESASSIVQGTLYIDANRDGFQNLSESGLVDIVVFLDANGDGIRNANETSTRTLPDNPLTPNVIEAGSFTLQTTANGNYKLLAELSGFSLSEPAVQRLSSIPAASLFSTIGGTPFDKFSTSRDGRYVVFSTIVPLAENSTADGCTSDSTNDVYLYDNVTRTAELISRKKNPSRLNTTCGGDGSSWQPVVSDDGRFVAFTSNANDLTIDADSNDSTSDVFLFDRQTKTMSRVSRARSGDANGITSGDSSNPSISADGRFIAFQSTAKELVTATAALASSEQKIYLYDRLAPQSTILVTPPISPLPIGPQSDINSFTRFPAISGDGRYVTFESAATNLMTGTFNGVSQVFVYDRTGVNPLKVISKETNGSVFTAAARNPSINFSGSIIAFSTLDKAFAFNRSSGIKLAESPASNIQNFSQSFVDVSVSPDGRFISFPRTANNIVSLIVRDLQSSSGTEMLVTPSINSGTVITASDGISLLPQFLSDGQTILFRSNSKDLTSGSTSTALDSTLFKARNPFFAPDGTLDLALNDGSYAIDLSFGIVPNPGVISGIVFEDSVANGVLETGEQGKSNVTVFLDLNSNGILDTGERSVITASDGTYQFLNTNSFRSYTIAINAPIGFEKIAPDASENFAWNIFLPAGGTVTNRDFALRPVQSTGQSSASAVSGRLYDDRNGNKVYDAGDLPVANREIYLDATNFGVRDTNEQRVLTDAQGLYSMVGLSAQTVAVSTTLDSTLVHVNPLGSSFTLQKTPLYSTIRPFSNPQAIASGDFNQDGFLDVALALGEANKLSIRLNNGLGGFLATEIDVDLGSSGSGPTSLVVGQFDNDSKLDVALTANYSSKVVVLLNFNPATNSFASQTAVTVGLLPIDLVAGQFGGDSKLDLAVVNQGSSTVASTVQLLTNNGSGIFTAGTAIPTGGKTSVSIVAGNFAGDASLDVAIVHASPLTVGTTSGGVTVLVGNGAGGLTLQPSYYQVGALPIDSVTADFNGDGRADMAVANFSSNSISILLGQANGTFRIQTSILGTASGAFDIAVADIDNDGDKDVIASNLRDRNISIFRNIGLDTTTSDVRFEPLENVGLGQFSLAQRMPLVVANFDNDTSGPGGTGTVDIVTIPQQTDTLHVLKNRLVNGAHRVALTGLNSVPALDFIVKSSILPPSLNTITNPLPILEDAAQQTIPLSGIARGRPTGPALRFVATSSQPTVVASASVQYTELSSTGSLLFTPVANASGTSIITVTVTDAGADLALDTPDDGVISRSFTVTVIPVNDRPTFTLPLDQTVDVNEDAGSQPPTSFLTGISVGGGAFESSQTLLPFVLTAGKPSLFLTQPAIDATGRLTFTGAANAIGNTSVLVTLKDNGGTLNGGVDTYSEYFFIAFAAVNDAPSITLGGNQSARVGSGAKTVSGFATGFLPGGGTDEATQIISDFIETNDNPAIFASQPAIDTSGVLRYTPSTTTSGTATVSVRVRDNGGTLNGGTDLSTARTFTITIIPFTTVADRKVFYNRSASTVFGNGTGNPTNAIDTSKAALLPGQTSTFANYTNYTRGLNGLVVDLAGTVGTMSASDFQFAVWNGIRSSGFITTTAVPIITVIPGGGTGGSTRVKIEFADNAIRNNWLRVTVLANVNTGMGTNDVFYFGHAMGDMNVGNLNAGGSTQQVVTTTELDVSQVRKNPSLAANSAGITSIYDVNKDGRVNVIDTSLVVQAQASNLLRYFTAPVSLRLALTPTSSLATPAIALKDLVFASIDMDRI
ncbi:MAG: S8 family serine peptidase [Pirellulaceae bacterium]|nr:S8 family serine peptidase [Pirellulaceae bacterium]